MVSNLFFYQLMLIALVWLCLMLHGLWPSESAAERLPTAPPIPPSRKRSKVPKPFPGLTRKPHCDACAQDVTLHREPPCAPPPRLISTRGRRRQVDISHHFCPDPDCRYGGWTGLGNISANGHPSGGPWRQLHCSRFGTREAVKHILAPRGWHINTACVERINLTIRQHVAAVGRRVGTLCKDEDGWRQQLVLYQAYDHFCLPHPSLRLPLPHPERTNGTGSAKRWQSQTPAMAAGLKEHV